jgi:ABC-type Fe3+ transport system substrate-binding protein
MGPRTLVLLALALVLSLPFVVRTLAGSGAPPAAARDPNAVRLVIITPHVEQIRDEFAAAFDRWHFRTHGQHAVIDWRVPGGTSDIVKQLEATFEAAARKGLIDAQGRVPPGEAGADLFFGGGSYEHGKMKAEHKAATPDGRTVTYRMGRPAGFDKATLDALYGDNKIGTQNLYDPDQYWLGTALSGFGIVYNRDVLKTLDLPEPRTFADLTDPRYFNLLALADGRQSGSVTTTYDSIMNKEGWDRGWRILREMSANARYFASSSTRPPIDVSQGEAAAGLAIDFYGRGQAQYLLAPGQDPREGRVGYVDPEGAAYIDADPVSILNGCQDFDLARRFVEFCLTDEAQALWQFHALTSPAARTDAPGYPKSPDGRPFGPETNELRRMPVRREMYRRYAELFVDKTDPFTIAIDVPSRGWRSLIAPLMAAMAIDTSHDLRAAWRALTAARAAAKDGRFPADRLAEMERLFYAMPTHTMRDGTTLELSEKNYKAISDDTKKWTDLDHGRRSLIAYTTFFRENYRRVTALGPP